MGLPQALAQTISAVGSLYGQLTGQIEGLRLAANDPSAPYRFDRAKPLKRVYQYTRLQTLLDVTQPWEWKDPDGNVFKAFGQRSVWATAAPYMNDRREYGHGCDVFRAAIVRRQELRRPNESSVLTMLWELLSEPLGRKFYVACFSEKSDDLGQWRGYGDWGKGVCLGYDYLTLENIRPWFSGWVIYKSATQDSLAELLIQTVIERVAPNIWLDPTLESQILNAAADVLRVILPAAILLMKDPAFQDEAEYRLIHAEDAPTPPQIKYRSRESRIIPYIEMTFADTSSLDPISAPLEEVVLGPVANDPLNMDAVRNLLISRGLGTITVTPSPIPFLP